MYKSECFNYDWFVEWLKRSLITNSTSQYFLSAKNISDHFSRVYYDVSIEDVVRAMEENGIPCVIEQGEQCYRVSYTKEAKAKIWKTFE